VAVVRENLMVIGIGTGIGIETGIGTGDRDGGGNRDRDRVETGIEKTEMNRGENRGGVGTETETAF
jgi:hypothetical protein